MLWMDDYLEDEGNISITVCANMVESRHVFTTRTNSRRATSDFKSQTEQEPLTNLTLGIICAIAHVNNE
jgi:hypothetical protein